MNNQNNYSLPRPLPSPQVFPASQTQFTGGGLTNIRETHSPMGPKYVVPMAAGGAITPAAGTFIRNPIGNVIGVANGIGGLTPPPKFGGF